MKKLLFLIIVLSLFLVLPNVLAQENCTDSDGDGFFVYNETLCPFGDDCDDTNNTINLNATEVPYDGIDQDCDGFDLTDVDEDGYDYPEDCDDNNESINPGQTEIPDNGIDEDCDGYDFIISCIDLDGDGFFVYNETTCPFGDDCDDNNNSINPNATEVPYDGIDQDCDGFDLNISCIDLDEDGFFAYNETLCLLGNDCDDNNSQINPNATEIPNNGIDDDCNNATLDDDADQDGINDTTDNCVNDYNPGQEDADSDGIGDVCDSECADGLDNDDDGFIDDQDPGCYDSGSYDENDDDESDTVAECSDNFDNDGDGDIDEEDKGCYKNGMYDPNDDNELGPGVGPGITPDSPLWGLDRAIERIRYILTFGKSAKARQGLAHALERLMEVREMIQAKKLAHAQKAQKAFEEDMELVEGLVDELGEDDAEDELEIEIEIEAMLNVHSRFVKKIRLKAKNMTQEQQQQVEELLASMEESNNDLDTKIKNKKNRTKIKIKAKQGLTSEEASDLENQIREKLGIASTPGKGKAKGLSKVTGGVTGSGSAHGKGSSSSGGPGSSGKGSGSSNSGKGNSQGKSKK